MLITVAETAPFLR
jgi:putative transcriptional regulator